MTVTLNLPPELERACLAEAGAKGMPVDKWIGEVLMERTAAGRAPDAPRKSRLWELREGLSLGEVSIRELIAEGRE